MYHKLSPEKQERYKLLNGGTIAPQQFVNKEAHAALAEKHKVLTEDTEQLRQEMDELTTKLNLKQAEEIALQNQLEQKEREKQDLMQQDQFLGNLLHSERAANAAHLETEARLFQMEKDTQASLHQIRQDAMRLEQNAVIEGQDAAIKKIIVIPANATKAKGGSLMNDLIFHADTAESKLAGVTHVPVEPIRSEDKKVILRAAAPEKNRAR